jgi:uncharacterized protein YqeY
MLRQRLNDAYKTAMRERDSRAVSALRMMMAALKDRDIAARPMGNAEGIGDGEILQMLQGMVKQRRESIVLYEKGGRPELAQQEADEITVIEQFLPRQMDEAQMAAAVQAVIDETGAAGIKDMGKVMAELKARHAGEIDFSKAGPVVKQKLA